MCQPISQANSIMGRAGDYPRIPPRGALRFYLEVRPAVRLFQPVGALGRPTDRVVATKHADNPVSLLCARRRAGIPDLLQPRGGAAARPLQDREPPLHTGGSREGDAGRAGAAPGRSGAGPRKPARPRMPDASPCSPACPSGIQCYNANQSHEVHLVPLAHGIH
jgi:hypothetical protein